METLLSLDKRANAKYSVESILDINIKSDETPEYQAFDQPFLLSIIVSGLSLFRGRLTIFQTEKNIAWTDFQSRNPPQKASENPFC
jgi:hypothetical protein